MTRGTRAWSRPVLSLAGLLLAYYAFPVSWSGSTLDVAVGLVLTAMGLGLLVGVMVQELEHLRAGLGGWSTGVLSTMLVLLIMVFSLAFYLLDLLAPEQIDGLSTRTDALYFTLSTMATVGYGDVHAAGQLARGLVCALIGFNIVVVASLVRAHTARPPE